MYLQCTLSLKLEAFIMAILLLRCRWQQHGSDAGLVRQCASGPPGVRLPRLIALIRLAARLWSAPQLQGRTSDCIKHPRIPLLVWEMFNGP